MSIDTLFIGLLLWIIIIMLSILGNYIFKINSEMDERAKARLIGSFSFMPPLGLGIFGIYLGISHLLNLSDIGNSSHIVWYWLSVAFLALGLLISAYSVINTLFVFSFKILKDGLSEKDIEIKGFKSQLIAIAGILIVGLSILVSIGVIA